MSRLLKEIANLEPYPYKSSGNGAEFVDKAGNRIGVVFEYVDLDLPTRTIEVLNVCFGVLQPGQKNDATTIDQSLTNAGDIRRVISTVGEIIVANRRVQDQVDCIVLAGADEAKERRQQIYAIATQDIINKLPRFKDRKFGKITFSSGAVGIYSLATDLTAEETPDARDVVRAGLLPASIVTSVGASDENCQSIQSTYRTSARWQWLVGAAVPLGCCRPIAVV